MLHFLFPLKKRADYKGNVKFKTFLQEWGVDPWLM